MSAATKAIFAIETIEDLREAQNALNVRSRELQRRAVYEFRVGDKVEFTTRSGEVVKATVTKINQKTVSVRAFEGTNWKVSGSLLRKRA